MEHYFPAQFKTPSSLRGWINYKERLLKELDVLLDPTDENKKALEDVNQRLINMIKTSNLADDELRYDKDFEKNCIVLSKFSNEPVERVSVRRYFTLLEHFNDLNKHGRAKNKVR